MEYGIVFYNMGAVAKPGISEAMAVEAENLGFDSIWVNDHLLVPQSERYVPDVLYDPLIVASSLAAATSRIQVGTSVIVVPLRNPIATAKAVATLDHMSDGRFIFGIGVGWLKEEFDAVGVDFHRRGAVTDEYLDVMQALWTTDPSTVEYGSIRVTEVRSNPKPKQSPLPVWVGGNIPASKKRAAERGTGWHPLNLEPDEFAQGVEDYKKECARVGKKPGPVAMRSMPSPKAPAGTPFTGSAAEVAKSIDQYAELGLDQIVFAPIVRSAEDFQTAMRFLAREVRPLAKS